MSGKVGCWVGVEYLGEAVGSLLPIRIHRSEHPFVADLEQVVDERLGAYHEAEPERGGSWSRWAGKAAAWRSGTSPRASS